MGGVGRRKGKAKGSNYILIKIKNIKEKGKDLCPLSQIAYKS